MAHRIEYFEWDTESGTYHAHESELEYSEFRIPAVIKVADTSGYGEADEIEPLTLYIAPNGDVTADFQRYERRFATPGVD